MGAEIPGIYMPYAAQLANQQSASPSSYGLAQQAANTWPSAKDYYVHFPIMDRPADEKQVAECSSCGAPQKRGRSECAYCGRGR